MIVALVLLLLLVVVGAAVVVVAAAGVLFSQKSDFAGEPTNMSLKHGRFR